MNSKVLEPGQNIILVPPYEIYVEEDLVAESTLEYNSYYYKALEEAVENHNQQLEMYEMQMALEAEKENDPPAPPKNLKQKNKAEVAKKKEDIVLFPWEKRALETSTLEEPAGVKKIEVKKPKAKAIFCQRPERIYRVPLSLQDYDYKPIAAVQANIVKSQKRETKLPGYLKDCVIYK